MALLDNGTQINTIVPNYVKSHSLERGPITDLIGTQVACMGLGNACIQPLGYVIVSIQVDGVQGYDEDQIALVVPDLLNFTERIPFILGTPTLSHIVNIMKEKETDTLATPCMNAQLSNLLSMHRATATVIGDGATGESGSNGYNKVVFTKNTENVDGFSSCIIPVKVERAYAGEHINIMTQAL